MKTINNKKKGTAMLITAAILTLVMLFAGCKHKTESKKSEPKYTITFGVDGTNGTLKAMVGGNEINTGDKVAQGKTVTFTATPSSGYKVKEWKLGNDIVTGNTSNTYTCTVTKAVTVKVSFFVGETPYKVKHYQEKEEGGYPAEPTETEDKNGAAGTNAEYTPKTGGAYEGFTYKSGLTKVNGTVQPSGTIKPDGSTVVELFYERNTVSVTFNLAGGNVAGNTDPIVKTGKYGTAFTAPADPVKTDDIFEGWNPSLPSPLLYPASNAEYTAQWQAVPKYTVTFGVEGTNGTLKAEVDGNEIHSGDKVKHGKTVTFTATPSPGYKVKEWKVGNDVVTGNTSNTYTCTVTQAVTVKVSFLAGEASYKVKHYKEKEEGGYPAEPTETENKSGTVGTNAEYTPKTGGAYEGFTYKSELTKINGTLQTSSTINGDGSTVVELYYERNTVNVTFNLAGGNVAGNTDPIVKTGKYGIAFTAPADPVKTDAVFKGWNPSLPSPLLYPASNAEYTAKWAPLYAITFGVTGTGGTLKATVDGGTATDTSPITVEQGKTVTFTATAAEGYEVDTWTVTPISALQSGTGTTGSSTATITVSAATEVKVTFKKLAYSITFGVEGTNGTLKAEVDGNEIHSGDKVTQGKTVTFTATPSSGYKVKEWKADGTVVTGNTSNTYTLTVTKAVHVTVSFAPLDVGSFEDTGDGFVKITPPANGIAGVDPDYTLPGTGADWKGVFIKDRKVKLSPYKLGKTEVTYKLWHEVLTWAEGKGYTFANRGREGSHGTDGAAPTANKNHPVTCVSWQDCIVWCNAYTEKEKGIGECIYRKSKTDPTVLKNATYEFDCYTAYADMSKKGFRLPTEAEWEYAARWQGSDKTNAVKYGDVWLTKLNSASGAKKPIGFSALGSLPEGETWESLRDELTRVAVYEKWWNGTGWVDQTPATTKTAAVKSKDPNALGLYDMSGNVREWCFDWYDTIAAGNVTDPQGAASGTYRVERGGSWLDFARGCTVGGRNYSNPDSRFNFLGFRLACRP